jgi:hypothetical protein
LGNVETINALDAIRAERDEQKKRYLLAWSQMYDLADLDTSDQQELERIERAVRNLTTECEEKEAALESLRLKDRDEYVFEMSELCDYEAKTFARLTEELVKLLRRVRLRHGSASLSNFKTKN